MNEEIKKVLYRWFDIKFSAYDRLEHDGSIYLYYDGEEYADIRILKKHEIIAYKSSIYEEFFQIISLDRYVFEGAISKWVGDTFNLKGFTPASWDVKKMKLLEIPLI